MEVSCADPGIFARGEGGGPKKTLITLLGISFFTVYRGVSMVYFKENYIFKVLEGIQHVTGEVVQIFPGGGGGKCKC